MKIPGQILVKINDLGLRLLRDGKGDAFRIRSVAEMIGFKSEAHFSRAFKKRFYMTPREARRLSLETKIRAKDEFHEGDVRLHMLEMFQTIGER